MAKIISQKTITKKSTLFFALALTSVSLTACQTTQTTESGKPETAVASKTGHSSKIDAAIERATLSAAEKGEVNSVPLLEKMYKRDGQNPETALKFAIALRANGDLQKASTILTPFAEQKDPFPGVKTEMSSLQLAMGDFKGAEKTAKEAVLQDPKDFTAYQNLGIALESWENHEAAERAFRKALEYWQGNPTTVMNNLALNLASQGKVNEAIKLLEKAKALSPERREIERNLRIVRAMNER